MKPAPFGYVAAESIEHALRVLEEHGDDAKLMSGGQSLVPLMNLRLAFPAMVVDISALDEMREYTSTGSGLAFGAATVHSTFEDGLVPDPTRGLLAAAAAGIGYRAIRNRGTVGGSLCHADSSAEWPMVMSALDARLVVRSIRAERTVSARGFVQGFFTNSLEDDEVLTQIVLDGLGATTTWGLHKTARRPGEFAESLAVVLLDLDGDRIRCADAWLGAATDVPLELEAFQSACAGQSPGALRCEDVVQLVQESLDPAVEPSDRYRNHLHGMTVWRAFKKAGGSR